MKLFFVANVFVIVMNIWMILLSLVVIVWFCVFVYMLIASADVGHVKHKHQLYFSSLFVSGLVLCALQPIVLLLVNARIHSRYPYRDIDYKSICGANVQNDLNQLTTVLFTTGCVDGALIYIFLTGVYVRRLILIFKDSMFGVSNKLLITYIIFVTVTIICIIGSIYGNLRQINALGIICGVIVMLSFLIESSYVCYVLLKKLTNFIKFIKRSSYQGSYKYKCSSNNNSNASKPLSLFRQTRKLTILTLITLITTFLNMIFNGILGSPGIVLNNSDDVRLTLVAFVYGLDALMNFSCLTLQFSFSQKIYDKTFKILESLPIFGKLESSLQSSINGPTDSSVIVDI